MWVINPSPMGAQVPTEEAEESPYQDNVIRPLEDTQEDPVHINSPVPETVFLKNSWTKRSDQAGQADLKQLKRFVEEVA